MSVEGIDTIDLMEFWGTLPREGEKAVRIDQWRLFSLLADSYDCVNIGMRSGGLEAPMLAGMKTVFLEEAGNTNPERMEKWLEAFPNYARVMLDAPLGGDTKRKSWENDKRLKKDGRSPLFKRILEQWKGKKRNFSGDELQAVTRVLNVARGGNFEKLKQQFGRNSTVNLNHRNREMYLKEWKASPVQKQPAAKLVEEKLALISSSVRHPALSSAVFDSLRKFSKMMKKQLHVILNQRLSPYERLQSVLVDQGTIRIMELKEVDGDRKASFPLVEYLQKGGVTQELFDIVESIVKAGVPDYALEEL